MKVGNRVYYVEGVGTIIGTAGEIDDANSPRNPDDIIKFIDLEYGSIDYSKQMIIGVDPVSKEVILKDIEEPQAKHIRELEDALLLQADLVNGELL
ncbi:hypothetical protein [Lysinibacillus pakistanensis]|uniref:Uncharacterized protein n=1 Tax=Lysinibacillus pakistanensis TaxID=759811 RepID=A0AAX3X2H1_9BACI|nr:hypothetical protein [Lysinibacillus pakistanensis]MDM5232586.1 hypothetical protein [Lysinibacillus pakistanensis]WHY48092.1 hypothetical protein QNH22_07650 [Lysinibacillus pakistanensis]WHY53104.1 hypothetical protein QNH24_07635 [Lysinibacillus pakistanensis]